MFDYSDIVHYVSFNKKTKEARLEINFISYMDDIDLKEATLIYKIKDGKINQSQWVSALHKIEILKGLQKEIEEELFDFEKIIVDIENIRQVFMFDGDDFNMLRVENVKQNSYHDQVITQIGLFFKRFAELKFKFIIKDNYPTLLTFLNLPEFYIKDKEFLDLLYKSIRGNQKVKYLLQKLP